MPGNGSTLALLIDGDDASPKIAGGLLAEVARYGVAAGYDKPQGRLTLRPIRAMCPAVAAIRR